MAHNPGEKKEKKKQQIFFPTLYTEAHKKSNETWINTYSVDSSKYILNLNVFFECESVWNTKQ